MNDKNNINIDLNKLQGKLYWGRYTLNFNNGYVEFIRNIPKVIDCTRTLKSLTFDELLEITNNIIGRTSTNEFKIALKKLEK